MVCRKLQYVFASLLLCFFSEASFGFVPVSVYGVPPSGITAVGVGGGGAVAPGAIPVIGVGLVSLGIGTALGYVVVDYVTDGLQRSLRIPLTAALPVSPPYAAPSVPVVPPESQICIQGTVDVTGFCGATAADACAAAGGRYDSPIDFGCMILDPTPSICINAPYTCHASYAVVTPLSTCDAGYSLSNSECVLIDARVAAPDNACDYERAGSALAILSDPDCVGLSVPPPANCSGGGCVITGTNDNNMPRVIELTPTVDGGTIINARDQVTLPNGGTAVQTQTITVGGDGNITATSGGTSPGSIDLTGPTPTVTPNLEPQVNPDPQVITIPTDYARQGEADAAAKTITDSDTAYRNGEQQRFQDRLGVAPPAEIIPNTESPVSITSVNFASAAGCPADIPFEMFATSYSISYAPLCDVMSMMRPLFLAFGAIGASMIFAGGLKS